MKIVLAGGTGFLGSPLAAALAGEHHDVVILTRRNGPHGALAAVPGSRLTAWTPDGSSGSWEREIDGAGAVVNLAGESIAARRWTDAQKRRILESRLLATRSLAQAIDRAKHPPSVFISGSAVGYYGPLGDEAVAEDHPAGSDFLAHVCRDWEDEAMRAAGHVLRVACIRTGLVLERDGGALPKMLPPFWFGAGGPIGSGRQYWPWIHRQDWIDLVRWVIRTPAATGPINATAPQPMTNREFARALGRAMHRPAWLPTPGLALRLLLGEMADALLLSGQRAIPAKAERLGFTFAYRDLDAALRAIFAKS
jgi:uncharacterized protein (TIGR01777 family)